MIRRDPYQLGTRAALCKYALAVPAPLHDSGKLLELTGLGLIAAPVAHSLVAGDNHDSENVARLKHLSDLAGLGLLAYHTLAH